MDPFLARMLERSKLQLSQLPENIADNARLRQKQLLEAYYVGLQQGVAAIRKQPEAETMQSVFKVPTTGFPVKKFATRSGKENKSPQKETRHSNIAVIAPCTAELYPRRPPRCVYNSPLITECAEAPLVFENRYKSKNCKSFPHSAAPKVETVPALNCESTRPLTTDKVQNTEPKTFQNPYPSLPKVNTSYDLDRIANKLLTSNCGRPVMGEKPNIPPKEFKESPSKDVNICTGGVKKMVEKFSQISLDTSPKKSPVRMPPKMEKFTRSPLASSTVNSPIKLVVPKLSHIMEPIKPEFRDFKRKELSPKVETPKVLPADNKPILPAYETPGEKPEPVSAEDSNTSLSSSDSAPVQTILSQDTDFNRFLSVRLENTGKHRRPVLQSSTCLQTSRGRPVLQSSTSLQTSSGNSDRVRRLTMEASVQRSLVAQSSKALYLCRTAKQFKESPELVEAERILLLASLRYQAAQEEIKKCGLPASKSASRGSLTISDIFVPLKRDVLSELDRNLCPQWFVCVLISGETVQATEIVQLVDGQPILRFKNSMHLSDLSCDFRARLQLYAFRAPHYSQKGKCKIIRACKMLRRPTRNCLGPAGSTEDLMYLRNPAFTMVGCTELTVGLIGQKQPVSCSLEQIPMVSLIKGTINFYLSAQLLNTREHSGFLNVLRPAGEGHAWQRWWCHLNGKALHCWNYPSDQEEKEPIFSIDLLECLSETVVPAPRVLCSRPRTLMLESQRCRGPRDFDSTLLACSPDSTIVRHFLSCDSAPELTEWTSAINECLEALYLWNIVPEKQDKTI